MTAAELLPVLIVVAVGYLIGAVPFGLLIGKWCGTDIRRAGSGNIGATNVWRVLGWRCGLTAFALDTLKGLVPTACAPRIWAHTAAAAMLAEAGGRRLYLAWLAVAAGVILGHIFPVYLRFRGGKGVATSLGALLGLWPYYTLPGLVCFALWGVVFGLSGYVSLSSMLAALAFPLVYLGLGVFRGWDPTGNQRSLLVFAVVMAVLVVYRHRTNLQRLLAGQENRFGKRSRGEADGPAA